MHPLNLYPLCELSQTKGVLHQLRDITCIERVKQIKVHLVLTSNKKIKVYFEATSNKKIEVNLVVTSNRQIKVSLEVTSNR